jgi:hypothetical protein
MPVDGKWLPASCACRSASTIAYGAGYGPGARGAMTSRRLLATVVAIGIKSADATDALAPSAVLVVKRWPAELFPVWTVAAGEFVLAMGHCLHRLRELSKEQEQQELQRLDEVLPEPPTMAIQVDNTKALHVGTLNGLSTCCGIVSYRHVYHWLHLL